MNKKQVSNLHVTLRSSFKAVKDDISRLKKRDIVLKDEISEVKKQIPTFITSDEFYSYVKKCDSEIEKTVDVDALVKSENKLSLEISSLKKDFNSEQTGLKDRMDAFDSTLSSELSSLKKDFNEKIDALKSELKKTDDLKKEVREVRSFKKQIADLEKTYAKKKQLDECFEEQDEIYDLIEDLEEKVLKKKDVDAYQKLVDDKLRKYRFQMDEVERIAEKLNIKMKDINDSERQIKVLTEAIDKISNNIQKVDKTESIKILSQKVKEGNSVIKAYEKKLNEVISVVNEDRDDALAKMTSEAFYKEEEEMEELPIEELDIKNVKVPEPKIFKTTKKVESSDIVEEDEPEKKRGFFGKIVDWFFEEVDEDEDEDEPLIEKTIESKKQLKSESKKEVVKKSKPETSKEKKSSKTKEVKPEVKKEKLSELVEEDEPEKKRGFFGKIVDWFLEEDEDDEDDESSKEELEKKKKE